MLLTLTLAGEPEQLPGHGEPMVVARLTYRQRRTDRSKRSALCPSVFPSHLRCSTPQPTMSIMPHSNGRPHSALFLRQGGTLMDCSCTTMHLRCTVSNRPHSQFHIRGRSQSGAHRSIAASSYVPLALLREGRDAYRLWSERGARGGRAPVLWLVRIRRRTVRGLSPVAEHVALQRAHTANALSDGLTF